MSDLAHRLDLPARACMCGSAWNWYAEACSYIVPMPVVPIVNDVEVDDWHGDFFECRKGHAFCGRH